MIRARTPLDEASRLESLQELRIVGTPHEEAFDRIVRLTAHVLQVPHAYLSFLGSDCEWFKAGHEWTLRELPRAGSVAAHAILGAKPLVVEDLADGRFPGQDLHEKMGVRAYAACPVRGPGGGNIGVLTVLDTQPRVFRRVDLEALADLARIVEDELALRRAPSVDTERERLAMRLALDAQATPVAVLDRQGVQRHCNEAWRRHGIAGTPIDPLDRAGRDHPLRLSDVEGPMEETCRAWARRLRDVLSGDARFVEMEWSSGGPEPRSFHGTAQRVGSGDETWVIVQHEDRTLHARSQQMDDEATTTALARDDLRAERDRRDRVVEAFLQRIRGIETPIAIQARLLQDAPGQPARRQQAAASILRGVQRWHEAAADLRFALQRADDEEADLGTVVRNAADAARSRAIRQGIRLHTDLAEEDMRVRLGTDDARRMVDALLDRALQTTPAGGDVHVACRMEQGKAVVEVQDEGGVPPQAEQSFDPVGLAEEPERAPLVRLRVLAERAGGWPWVYGAQMGLRLGFTLPILASVQETPHQHA